MSYPCSGCGSCCKRIDRAVANAGDKFDFPYKWDESGKCEMLTTDNKCLVYDSRPLICNIDRMAFLTEIPKSHFYAINIVICNQMMNEDGIDIKFRINE